MAIDDVIVAVGLHKSFKVRGKEIEAVRGIDFAVAKGEICGFLAEWRRQDDYFTDADDVIDNRHRASLGGGAGRRPGGDTR